MTPQQLRAHCDSLNPGGQTKLAKLIGMHATLLRKKLAGKVKIRTVDELAVEEAVKRFKGQKKEK
jgi:DNA-binding transcriptional regulator YdaS (Cro superfamily)